MRSILAKAISVLIVGGMTACAAEDSTKRPTPVGNDSKNESPSASTAGEQAAGKSIADASYRGLIELGMHDGWSLYLDKDNNQIVVSDAKQSATFDPSTLEDEAAMASLVSAGIPETVLWSCKGVLCRAACWGADAAGCAAATATCTLGPVVTIGGVALPCAVAMIAACGASGVGTSVCSDWCSKRFGQ